MPKAMTLSDWGLLFSLSLLWGGSFFFAGVALRELPPLTLVALRVGVAALVLNLALPALGLRIPRERRILAAFLGMGLLNNALPFSLIVWGQTHIASGLAAILNATTPLWTVLLAHRLARGEKLTAPRFAGAAAGLAGVAVMIGPPCSPTSAPTRWPSSPCSRPPSPMRSPASPAAASAPWASRRW